MIHFWNLFVKLTGWPVQFLCFRTKIYYEDRRAQGRRIRGGALVISNHTAVYDYAVYLFVFWPRLLRFQMAELLFRKKPLGSLLRALGGIRVDRENMDFGFLDKSRAILERGGVVGIFPESRLPRPGEARPLPFKTSAAYLALLTGVPVIPVVTNGSYFRRERARVMIGRPVYAADLAPEGLGERETVRAVSEALRERIIELEKKLHDETEKR